MLLSRNRVLGPRKPEGSLSAKAGRTLIRKHHTLHKQKAQALAQNNLEIAQKIDAEIEASGGLEKYQRASVSETPSTLLRPQKLTFSRSLANPLKEEVIRPNF